MRAEGRVGARAWRRRSRAHGPRRARPWFAVAAFAPLTSILPVCSAGGPTPTGTAPPDTVRVVSYNIHHGEGMDGRVDLERVAALLDRLRPDLVALQEVDRGVERTGRVDQAAELGRLTGLEPVFGSFMPYQGGEYGMAVLSRWPVLSSVNHRLPPGAEPRSSVTARVRSPRTGRVLSFADVHFYRSEAERLAQALRLTELLDVEEGPVLLVGDFNSTPDSDVIDVLAHTWAVVDKGADRLTFPSYGPEREIDYVMYRSDRAIQVLDAHLEEEPVISDHRPVFVRLVIHEP